MAIRVSNWEDRWAVPALLAPMTALTTLELDHQIQLCSGSGLGQILQALVALQELSMSMCQLAAVPAALSRCTQLKHLNLSFNKLADGWQHLQPLAQLQHLSVSDTAFLPPSLQQLTQLTGLELDSCSNVAAFMPHVAALRLLRSLDLMMNSLTEVPAEVAALTALTALFLCVNQLRGGFDHLRPLVQLRELALHNNDLAEVPAAIAALTALQTLRLDKLRAGWQHLRPLAQLQTLGVCWRLAWDAPDSDFLLASEAAANLHPAAVERMLAEPDGDLPRLLAMLEQRGLPRPF